MNRSNKRLIGLLLAAFILYLPGRPNAWGQPSIDQATKEVDRAVPKERIEKKLTAPSKKPPKIKEEPEEKPPTGPAFFVKKIKLAGIESFPEEDFRSILEKYENRTVAFSELEILAKKIERAYLKKGVIAACFFPPQEARQGVITLQVVEAHMGELQVKEAPFFSKKMIARYWRFKPGDVLHYDKISRSLQLINSNPDRYSKVTLHAGKKPGTTNAILETKTKFPIHVTLSLDREGAPSTGKTRQGFGLVNNNFMGFDDTLIIGYTYGKNFGGGYFYHKIPFTNYGTSAIYGYSQVRAFPKKDYAVYEMNSRAETASLFIHQSLYQKDDYVGEISAGFEAKDKGVVWNRGTLQHDKTRALKIGGLILDRAGDYVAYLKPSFSQGLNFFGARRRNSFTSRHASNTFSKATAMASFKKAISSDFQTQMRFYCQLAGQGLMPQEELYIGGIDSVRGYPDGDFLADNGYYGSAELLVPPFFLPDKIKTLQIPYGSRPIADEVTGVLFFDYGYGMKRNLQPSEINCRKFASIGAGIRIKLIDQALLRLEWGFPVEHLGDFPTTEFSRSRLHFSLTFQDDMPEEACRVCRLMEKNNMGCEAWGILNEEMKNPVSPLRKKIYRYSYLGDRAYEKNDLRTASKYYAKVVSIGEAAHRQATAYVKETVKQRRELEEFYDLGNRYYKNGDFARAELTWNRIKEEAVVKPLFIKIL